MTERDAPDMWWADESPVGTGNRRNGGGSARTDRAPERAPERDLTADGPGSGDRWPVPDPERRGRLDPPVSAAAPPSDRWGDVPDPAPLGRDVPDPGPGSWGEPDPAGWVPDPALGRSPSPDHGAPARSTRPTGGPGLSPSDPLAAPGREGAPRQWFVPPPEELPPFDDEVPGADRPRAAAAVPAAPVLAAGRAAVRPPHDRTPPSRPSSRIDRRRLAVVYDVDGPRVRLGVAWFVVVLAATVLSPFTTALAFAVAAGFAGRQVVRAWGSVAWQADVGAGIAAVPVLAATFGTPVAVGAAVLGSVVAVGAAAAPDGARLPGSGGRVAAAGILALALVPALGGACMVLVRSHSVIAAVVLLGVASAYEVGDYIVGSGAGNPIEGPLAGITTATLVALPLSLVLVEPYDTGGVALLVFTAAACPFGQILASATLPGAGAHAPALRRIDTLLVLALVWAAAAAAF